MHAIQRSTVAFLVAALTLPFLVGNPSQAVDAASSQPGARITVITPEGPAQKAGLEVDDVIIAVDTEPVRSEDEFERLLAGKRRVTLLVKSGRNFIRVPCAVWNGRIGIRFYMTRT